jgi:ABC-type Mn2+/Zn2+ transport system permease subunit
MTFPGGWPAFDWQTHVFDLWRFPALPDTLTTVAMGALVALACGWLGCFLILQGQSLLGDAISHTVLLGIVLAALLTGSTSGGSLLLAALLTGVLTAWLIQSLGRVSRIKPDAATGIVFTTLFALGVFLLGTLAGRAHLDPQHTLYGLLEFVSAGPRARFLGISAPVALWQMLAVCGVLLTGLLLTYSRLVLASFDPGLSAALGQRPRLWQAALLGALSLTVVVAFSSVGAVLVVGLLVIPPATAFLLCQRFSHMLVCTSLLGVLAAVVGYHVAAWLETTAAATIVCVASIQFAVVFLLGPREGLVARWVRLTARRVHTAHENLARLLLKLGADSAGSGQPTATLASAAGRSPGLVRVLAVSLWIRGWATWRGGRLGLTARGLAEAHRLDRAHRLWEAYLVSQVGVALDHVHPTAEELEHLLDDTLIARIDDALGHPGIDPHGALIPRLPISVNRPTVFALSRLRVGESGRLVGIAPPVDPIRPGDRPVMGETDLPLGGTVHVLARDSLDETWTIAFTSGRQVVCSHTLADQLLIDLAPADSSRSLEVAQRASPPGPAQP